MTVKENGPPRICGARHPRGFGNVGPCQIYGEHDAHLFPHRGIAQGLVEVGFDTAQKHPVYEHRRWWREWYDEPRAEWPHGLYEWPRPVVAKDK